MPDLVEIRVDGPVAILTLCNPPLNVVNLALTRDLNRHLDGIAQDTAVRAVIITGQGERAFCAGSDVSEFKDMTLPGQVVEKKLLFQNAVFRKLESLRQPTIAAINGLAYGGGLEIALCCDLLVMDEKSRLALPEIKLGVFPSSGGTFRLTRKIGAARAKEMIFLGEPIDAETALRYGLVNRIARPGASLRAAVELAHKLSIGPRRALALAKALINDAFNSPTSELIEKSLAASDQAFTSPECREGVRAFFAKEPAKFD
ncbi:enoyl-CoA hydratase/isomerase family protein [Paralcaligenes sp. KSB-10]|uniref:enoyl-CoA hydratase/isomerase family protein n=1 Tax=Paralcaligenes sp. KSB-10 TaxID=2901142 RepID=UPI001E60053E|nr:enoyl-CoA hydratase/isomerase family protein [Paralcaligenes sp. KSB-10]UHL65436.1 enoyl-CoA hydratase/isomerase family protein [Paralcaligenes sp. KSB-10]